MVGKIKGTGSYRPVQVWDNAKLSHMMETSDEWIRGRTGIGQRHIASRGETVAYMAARAAGEALRDAEVRPEEIDLILVSTMSAERIMPCAACEVQKLIGAVNATCFDLNSACTGFLLALNTAQAYLGQQIYKRALVIGAEVLSHLTNWQDRSTCVLFGDGAGAVVLEAEEDAVYVQATHSIGKGGEALTCTSRNQPEFAEKDADISASYMQMDGKEVFKFAVSKVPEVIFEVLEKAGKTKDEIRFYMLHQANQRIVSSVAKHMKEPLEKYPMNIERLGNTSSASIPLLLDEWKKRGKLNPGDWIVLAGFGGGLTYGASLMRW
ncbi:beta-ketoacyl-ACP synthase III [Blautia sp. Sow4_E7]|uniref:beta-ketoacyl-ACP synthase III n=1 Tax=Blautia sp. Sow4_E7 TaxID=3438749 RepID=UPI003F93467F